MLSRRNFLGFSLVLACSPSVLALGGIKPHLRAKVTPKGLVVDLELENLGTTPVDILFLIGERSAIGVEAALGGVKLELIEEHQTAERFMTRAGPRRQWKPIPAHGRIPVAPLAFRLPEPAQPSTVTFSVTVQTLTDKLRLEPIEVTL
jgi:hypothetical protein